MAQTARPASDISVGSWSPYPASPTTLFDKLDETSQDGDTTYATGGNGAGTFEVKLGSMDDPVSSADHTVYLWGKGVGGGGPEKVDVYLYESTTLIATIISNWAPGRTVYAQASYTLSSGEADSISDYTDLRVRVVEDTIGGGEEFRVTQIYMEVPDATSDVTLYPAALSVNSVQPLSGSGLGPAPEIVTKAIPASGSILGLSAYSVVNALPTPTIFYGVTLTPNALICTRALPAASTDQTIKPSAFAASRSFPSTTIVKGAVTLTPAALSVVGSLSLAGSVLGVAAAVSDSTFPGTAVIKGGVTLTPTPYAVTKNIPISSLIIKPSPVPVTITCPDPNIIAGAITVQPSPVSVTVNLPVPVIVKGGVTIQATPESVIVNIPDPVIVGGGDILIPSPLVIQAALPLPTIIAGEVILYPSGISVSITIPDPNITEGISYREIIEFDSPIVTELIRNSIITTASIFNSFIITERIKNSTIATAPVLGSNIVKQIILQSPIDTEQD